MRKTKRGSDATRGLRKNRKARKTESLVSGRLYGDPNEDVWTGLSDEQKSYLSKSVTSITLCNGDTTLFSCSGIAIDRQGIHLTRFLTSASLVTALNDIRDKNHLIDIEIEVRHEGNLVYEGVLAEFDLNHNFAVIEVYAFVDVHVGPRHVLEIPSHGDVLLVALGHGVSGQLITRTVMLSGDLRVSEDEDRACKISEAWEGGPLFSFDGNCWHESVFDYEKSLFPTMEHNFRASEAASNSCTVKMFEVLQAGIGGPVVTLDGDVIGMNFYNRRIGTPFLPWECISGILEWSDGKSKPGKIGNDGDSFIAPFCKMTESDKDRLNRWPVPMPCWRHPDYSDEDNLMMLTTTNDFKYTYQNGEKFMLR